MQHKKENLKTIFGSIRRPLPSSPIDVVRIAFCLFVICLVSVWANAGEVINNASSSDEEVMRRVADPITYDINDAWIDSNTIYISYVKTTRKHRITPFNIWNPHDSHTKYVRQGFYQKVDITSMLDGQIVELKNGISAPGLIYIDSNFDVHEKNGAIFIRNQNHEFKIGCEHEIWGNPKALRIDDKLFYCGRIVPLAGNKLSKLPIETEKKIINFYDPKNTGNAGFNLLKKKTPAVSLVVKDGRNINIFPSEVGLGGRNPRMEFFAINIDTMMAVGSKKLPFDRYDAESILGSLAYIPDGFVIHRFRNSGAGRGAYVCKSGKCTAIDIQYMPFTGSLIIDYTGDSGILISGTYPSVGGDGKYTLTAIKHLSGQSDEVILY